MHRKAATIVSNMGAEKLLGRFMRLLAAVLTVIYLFGYGWALPAGWYSVLYLFLVIAFLHRVIRPDRGLYLNPGFALTVLAVALAILEQGQLAITQYDGQPSMPMAMVLAALCLLIYDTRRFILRSSALE